MRLLLIGGLGIFFSSLMAVGCTGNEEQKPEPQTSKEMANTSASEWTEEQKAAFKTAHDRARQNNDK